jgi:glyoxylase-like metal-dependent hydrolase (beta-lactamase superfamily II)
MKTHRHTPNLVRLTRLGAVNAFFVVEDDGLTLVDTMIPKSQDTILAAARELGLPIARIALTHAHGDHVGSLDALATAVPTAEVSISARDARLLAGDMSLDPDEPKSKLRGGYPKVQTRPGRTLQPGDRVGSLEVVVEPIRKLNAGDRVGSLEVVASPGHTPGHVAFLDTRDRTLYCGDAYSTLGGVATSAKANPRFPLPALATWDRPTALRTARELRALDPARLAVGHGKVVEAPAAAMDAAVARAEGR